MKHIAKIGEQQGRLVKIVNSPQVIHKPVANDWRVLYEITTLEDAEIELGKSGVLTLLPLLFTTARYHSIPVHVFFEISTHSACIKLYKCITLRA